MIDLIYSQILDQYKPDENEGVNSFFNYSELVSVIEMVSLNHIKETADLFSRGIEIVLGKKRFYAIVENNRPCIITMGPYLNKGKFGAVSEVYEIATSQILAFKQPFSEFTPYEQLAYEIDNLNLVHKIAEEKGLSVEGLQDPPIAVFKLHQLDGDIVGIVGPKYKMNLEEWVSQDHTNQERIALCKSVMKAYKNLLALKIWHGDLKPKNIMIHEQGVKFIDWAGAIPFEEAAEKMCTPRAKTYNYISTQDYKYLDVICGISDHKKEFIRVAKAVDLFAISIVLFRILASCRPFTTKLTHNHSFAYTKRGILPDSLGELVDRFYPHEIMMTLKKMLSHDFCDRLSPSKSIEFWEKI